MAQLALPVAFGASRFVSRDSPTGRGRFGHYRNPSVHVPLGAGTSGRPILARRVDARNTAFVRAAAGAMLNGSVNDCRISRPRTNATDLHMPGIFTGRWCSSEGATLLIDQDYHRSKRGRAASCINNGKSRSCELGEQGRARGAYRFPS